MVEVIIVAALILLMIEAIYAIFTGLWRHFTRGTVIIELERESRLVLERIKNDLRAAWTRGINISPDLPSSEFHSIILENPDPAFGEPLAEDGTRLYTHGYTLKFFKFAEKGTSKQNPKVHLVQYSFETFTDTSGNKTAGIRRIEDDDGTRSNGVISDEILMSFPLDNNSSAFLYFVYFELDDFSVLYPGENEKITYPGEKFVRIQFKVQKPVKNTIQTVDLITVVNLRQITSFHKDSTWVPNPHTRATINADLMPSNYY